MSWKDYQNALPREKRRLRRPSIKWAWAIPSLIGLFALVQIFGGGAEEETAIANHKDQKVEEISKAFEEEQIRRELANQIPLEVFRSYDANVKLQHSTLGPTRAEITIDQDLQRFILKQLQMYKVDWGSVVVIDAQTGAILATASHSEKEPQRKTLAFDATFPAASIFKMVTAVAAIEEAGSHAKSLIPYSGNVATVNRREITSERGRYAMSLEKAFALSANLIFGKIGAQKVNENLEKYAQAFGFNQDIPLDRKMDISKAVLNVESDLDKAKLAAGFGDVQLSPVHGAMIGASVAYDGIMMKPYMIQRYQSEGSPNWVETKPEVWKKVMEPSTADELRQMMHTTIQNGTAAKGFRKIRGNPILGVLDMGGKTGSLTGSNPKGKTEWFVGYARSRGRKIGIGVVMVSEKYWRVKPSVLSRKIFEYAYAPRPVLEAKVGQKDSRSTL